MGVGLISIFDEDGVSEHNLPNQFFRKKDEHQFKVIALEEMVKEFSESMVLPSVEFYQNQKLLPITIVGTDSMSSRKLVWQQFKKQQQARYYIEARMGAEVGVVYVIKKKFSLSKTIMKKSKAPVIAVSVEDQKFYEEMLYPDSAVKPLPCTGKSIIYNILMISSVICRAVKGCIHDEDLPREITINTGTFDETSFMIRS